MKLNVIRYFLTTSLLLSFSFASMAAHWPNKALLPPEFFGEETYIQIPLGDNSMELNAIYSIPGVGYQEAIDYDLELVGKYSFAKLHELLTKKTVGIHLTVEKYFKEFADLLESIHDDLRPTQDPHFTAQGRLKVWRSVKAIIHNANKVFTEKGPVGAKRYYLNRSYGKIYLDIPVKLGDFGDLIDLSAPEFKGLTKDTVIICRHAISDLVLHPTDRFNLMKANEDDIVLRKARIAYNDSIDQELRIRIPEEYGPRSELPPSEIDDQIKRENAFLTALKDFNFDQDVPTISFLRDATYDDEKALQAVVERRINNLRAYFGDKLPSGAAHVLNSYEKRLKTLKPSDEKYTNFDESTDLAYGEVADQHFYTSLEYKRVKEYLVEEEALIDRLIKHLEDHIARFPIIDKMMQKTNDAIAKKDYDVILKEVRPFFKSAEMLEFYQALDEIYNARFQPSADSKKHVTNPCAKPFI